MLLIDPQKGTFVVGVATPKDSAHWSNPDTIASAIFECVFTYQVFDGTLGLLLAGRR
jgi:hypothetical protein